MLGVNHFTYGWINPVLAVGMSVLGSMLGLICATRARQAQQDGRHAGWLALAAVSIGGTGIWLMHFLAMLGFTVVDGEVRYDVPRTIASAVAAVVVVGVGLFIVLYREPTMPKLLAGGLFTGIGVAAVQYLGMAAMRVHGALGYSVPLMIVATAIAVLASTGTLWFAAVAERPVSIAGASVVTGLGVTVMHYTAMAGLHVRAARVGADIGGANPSQFLGTTTLLAVLVLIVVLYAVVTAPTESDRADLVELRRLQSTLGQ